jgi:two-component system chemotaxis response regulator CheY
LLVEPSRTQAAIIREYLKNLGIEPMATVVSCADALAAVRNRLPDAIISAMYLKDTSGVQLAHDLATETRGQRIGFVLISSEEESKSAGSLSKAGNALVLHKPFDFEKLRQALSVTTGRDLRPSTTGPLRGLSDSKLLLQRGSDDSAVRQALARVRILLVDDSQAARHNERAVLQRLGATQITEANDGAQAVAILATEKFDLIVTDYNMPHMDGRSLIGYLRVNPATSSVPIIMVTTETDPGKLQAIRRLGVAAICDKTFKPEVVRPILEQLFR